MSFFVIDTKGQDGLDVEESDSDKEEVQEPLGSTKNESDESDDDEGAGLQGDEDQEEAESSDESSSDGIEEVFRKKPPTTTPARRRGFPYRNVSEDEVEVKDEDDDHVIIPALSDEEDDDGPVVLNHILKMNIPEGTTSSKSPPKHGEIDTVCSYFDFQLNESSEYLTSIRQAKMNKLLKEKSIAHKPGLEKLEKVPNNNISDRKLKKIRKAERAKTKGGDWFNLPAPEVTEEVKRDLEVLQMRSVLDPKTFYKKNDLKVLPKYFQIGRVADNSADFYHSRIPKKERKRTLVDELLADAEFQKRSKQKFKEIIQDKKRTQSGAHRHAKRLKRRK